MGVACIPISSDKATPSMDTLTDNSHPLLGGGRGTGGPMNGQYSLNKNKHMHLYSGKGGSITCLK